MTIPTLLNFDIDEQKDVEEILPFVREKDPFMLSVFPELEGINDDALEEGVRSLVHEQHQQYGVELARKCEFLRSNKARIVQVMEILARVCQSDWEGFEQINIFMSVNPIAPRSLKQKYFLLPVFEEDETLLSFCAHELLHFIYFKKWHELFSDEYATYEYPHRTWVLSELLAPVILGETDVQAIAPGGLGVYPHWREIEAEFGLLAIFRKLFDERKDFASFIEKSLAEYDRLDGLHQLTQRFTA